MLALMSTVLLIPFRCCVVVAANSFIKKKKK